MVGRLAESVTQQPGDSFEFLEIVRNVVMGVARDYRPQRLYVVRIDNWFGPHWFYFSGKALGALGIWKDKVTVPPFVPRRVVSEDVFVGPEYGGAVERPSLHLNCSSSQALSRRISDFDADAAFIWFSSESELQTCGSVMVYLPVTSDDLGFYAGYSLRERAWEPVMLRDVSRSELAHIEERGRLPVEPIHA